MKTRDLEELWISLPNLSLHFKQKHLNPMATTHNFQNKHKSAIPKYKIIKLSSLTHNLPSKRISLHISVTLLAWIAHKLVSSNRPTNYASLTSYSAASALIWNLKFVLMSCVIYLISLWNDSL